MGVFSSNLTREVRLERMRPEQIDAAKAECPAIYVPFGSIEWHGRQNPVGLDALRAHEPLVGLARRAGGVVYPPIFFGSGGGHVDYPYSYMFEPADLQRLAVRLLHLLQRDGFKTALLYAGHGPNLTEILQPAVAEYLSAGGTMRTLALLENQIAGAKLDHAAQYETSYMLYLHPELVDLSRLTGHDQDRAPAHERRNWMDEKFKNHPLYGLSGPDPRGNSSAEEGRQFTDTILNALTRWVQGEDLPLVFK